MALLTLSIAWGIFTTLVGAVMYASQVGPNEAVSKLSLWANKFGIEHPPEWLKAKSVDRRWRNRAAVALAALLLFGGFLGGMAFEEYLRPPATERDSSSRISNRWEPLSAQEALSLRENWRSLVPTRLSVLCAIPACADLAESIYDVAHELNWPAMYASTYYMDHGIQPGLEIWSYPEVISTRDKLADSVERATGGRLKISRHQWDSAPSLPPDILNGISLVIGRLK